MSNKMKMHACFVYLKMAVDSQFVAEWTGIINYVKSIRFLVTISKKKKLNNNKTFGRRQRQLVDMAFADNFAILSGNEGKADIQISLPDIWQDGLGSRKRRPNL